VTREAKDDITPRPSGLRRTSLQRGARGGFWCRDLLQLLTAGPHLPPKPSVRFRRAADDGYLSSLGASTSFTEQALVARHSALETTLLVLVPSTRLLMWRVGQPPVTVLLVEKQGADIATLVTTAALAERLVH
jgi:hypothetical protein